MHTDIPVDLWSSLQHPQVRNLAWCVFSRSLVAADASSHCRTGQPLCSEADRAWLFALDAAPEPLLQWMARCHSTQLGFQFEYYWQFWWQHRHPQREYRFNVQLSDQGKTLGELDALSWDAKQQRLTHTELAVKFYLGVPSEDLPAAFRPIGAWAWVGPNVRDRLDLKWKQLQERQLRHLLTPDHSQIHTELPAHWHFEELQTQLIMRGRLFYPDNQQPDWLQTPYLNRHHEPGVWMRRSEFLRWVATRAQASRWLLLDRRQWFAPRQCGHSDTLTARATAQLLHQHFAAHHQPVQLARMRTSATGTDHYQEDQRWFVVPDAWPHRH